VDEVVEAVMETVIVGIIIILVVVVEAAIIVVIIKINPMGIILPDPKLNHLL